MKKGSKRTREGTLTQVPALNQVVWRTDAPNERQGELDKTTAMGAFVGDNYDLVSQLAKDILSKEQELQKSKRDLEVAEARHLKEIELLKKEHEDKYRQSQNKIDHLKSHLEKSELLSQQQTNQNATLEKQLKELQLSLVASTFSTLTAEEFKQSA